MNPKVSIITTFYNSVKLGDFVNKSMQCLLNQTYKNIEFICVHDGSNDGTLEQLKDYAKKDSRIIIVDKKNEGTAQYAKAAGQDIASGDYIMLFDHDDAFDLEGVEKAVKTFNEYPDLEMVGFIVKVFFSDGRLRNIFCLEEEFENESQFKFKIISGEEALKKTVGYYHFHFRGFYRKDVFKKESFRFEKKLVNADEIVERKILEKVKKIGNCNAVYNHFIYANSSAKSFNLKKTDFAETDSYLRKYFKEINMYHERAEIFELTAYKNIVNGIKAYLHFLPTLNVEEKKFYYNRLNNAFGEIDRTILLKNYSGISKAYNYVLSRNFKMLLAFYKLKK